MIFALLTAIITVIYSVHVYQATPTKNAKLRKTAFKVTLDVTRESPLQEQLHQELVRFVTAKLTNANPSELLKIAKLSQRKFHLEKVVVAKVASDRVVVTVNRRQMMFCLEADKLRFVSTSLTVYGHPSTEDCQNLTVDGIYKSEKQRDQNLAGDGSLILSSQEKKGLEEVAKFLQTFDKTIINEIKSVHYNYYRGLLFTHGDSDTVVIVGFSPFHSAKSRLERVLNQLSDSKKVASRIELDYPGKAFIKYKNM